MTQKKEKLTIEEQEMLWKSMEEIGYSEEEINNKKQEYVELEKSLDSDIEKAKKAEKKEEEEDKVEDKEENKEEEGKEEKEEDDDDVEKSISAMYKGMKEMYSKMEKAMTTLEDKYGKLPLVNAAKENTELKKSEESEDLEKSEQPDIMKSFDDMSNTLKGFMDNVSDKLEKSEGARKEMQESFEAFMDSPLTNRKPIVGEYNLIEKGEKVNDKGKRVLSISRNKNEILKSLNDCFDKSENVEESKILESGIFQATCGGIIDVKAAKILQRDMNVEFEA